MTAARRFVGRCRRRRRRRVGPVRPCRTGRRPAPACCSPRPCGRGAERVLDVERAEGGVSVSACDGVTAATTKPVARRRWRACCASSCPAQLRNRPFGHGPLSRPRDRSPAGLGRATAQLVRAAPRPGRSSRIAATPTSGRADRPSPPAPPAQGISPARQRPTRAQPPGRRRTPAEPLPPARPEAGPAAPHSRPGQGPSPAEPGRAPHTPQPPRPSSPSAPPLPPPPDPRPCPSGPGPP